MDILLDTDHGDHLLLHLLNLPVAVDACCEVEDIQIQDETVVVGDTGRGTAADDVETDPVVVAAVDQIDPVDVDEGIDQLQGNVHAEDTGHVDHAGKTVDGGDIDHVEDIGLGTVVDEDILLVLAVVVVVH